MIILALARKLLCLQISNYVLLKRPKQPFIFHGNHFSVRGKLGVLWGNEKKNISNLRETFWVGPLRLKKHILTNFGGHGGTGKQIKNK